MHKSCVLNLILLELIMRKFPFRMIIINLESVLEYKMMIIVHTLLFTCFYAVNSLICTMIMIHTIINIGIE